MRLTWRREHDSTRLPAIIYAGLKQAKLFLFLLLFAGLKFDVRVRENWRKRKPGQSSFVRIAAGKA
jgi:hypothetical protein